jgi:hypothetical protein
MGPVFHNGKWALVDQSLSFGFTDEATCASIALR